jgi:hypothetical protein
MFKNISNFNNIEDYLSIITAAIIIDMVPIIGTLSGNINLKSLNNWYINFGLSAVLADVLSIVLGIVLSRYIYPFIFSKYSLIKFIILTCIIQNIHDLLFAKLFFSIPKNKSFILDTFKEYAIESGFSILYIDSLMMIFTILLAGYLANFNKNTNIIILMICLYIFPYLLYSIKK